jgi:hypothetical protein
MDHINNSITLVGRKLCSSRKLFLRRYRMALVDKIGAIRSRSDSIDVISLLNI